MTIARELRGKIIGTTSLRFPAYISPIKLGSSTDREKSDSTTRYNLKGVMILNEDDDDGEQSRPHLLSETLDSLLGSKVALTPTWADSVRRIMGSAESGSPKTCSSDMSSPSATSSMDTSHDQDEQDRLDREIAKLEGELIVLRTALGVSNSHRRGALNRMLDLKGNIRVFCRVRPFLPAEKHARAGPVTTSGVDVVKIPSAKKEFQFDRVFQPSSVQDDVFAEVEPIIRSALDGHNVCIFAYGQTGTGKTFTMEGSKDRPGVVPRTLQRLFQEASFDSTVTYSYSLSMLEVYKGSIRDLLVARPTRHNDVAKSLSIQMGSKGFIEVEHLTEFPIADVKEASLLYMRGSRRRSTAWTNANDASSRSHCLLRINITCTTAHTNRKRVSKLWLIDLGGSERLLKTNAQGLTMEEGRAINVSLSALGDVINALQTRRPHVPYRNSKLTQILRDSLGEDSKTLMLVHVSPKEIDLGESICSLSFATRARGTHLGRQISLAAECEKVAAMSELYRQMSSYENECQLLHNSIKSVESLLEEHRKKCKPEEVSSGPAVAGDTRNPSQSSLLPCENPEKNDTESSTISPSTRSVPRFMSPTASSRGKKSPGLSSSPSDNVLGKAQQPPMTFTAGHTKRIVAPRGALGSMRCDSQGPFATHMNPNPKRKLAERTPWPASMKRPGNGTIHAFQQSINLTEAPPDEALILPGAGENCSPVQFTELSINKLSMPVYQSAGSGEHLSRILAADRSTSKLAGAVRGSSTMVPKSRRRLSLDCGSLNGTMKRFVF